MPQTVLCAVGTRPEAIKLAPVILALKACPEFDVRVLNTAQHRGMLDKILACFGLVPDIDLDIMRPNQSLAGLTARLLTEIDRVLGQEKPALVLAQGDTTTVMTVAMACFYRRIEFGHVEAGLRTGDIDNPFPEEMNRIVAGRLASLHFAPTEGARQNLLRERVPDNTIWMTGNTVIDALLSVAHEKPALGLDIDESKRLVLVTAHRRENFGEPLRNICCALLELLARHDDIQILFPVHPNPNVRDVVFSILDRHPRIILTDPLDYVPFVAAMQHATLILSDSGGVQEEAPALGKPVLVLRHETERPEAIEAGVVRLVGTRTDVIVEAASKLLNDPGEYRAMARGVSPYGDGRAAGRIVDVLKGRLC
ncbi:UDP-N-acetylglucosamine 2-epimerase [Caballeronia novacaledonica]|uniref:UDP-N-acetylglucosamine 2-epimerase (non-hydrolyzing) n=1 Tax=Caballeronia novacaledonica TaxID=1544861 RepID=A0A2U3I6M4_9BURK|nr:UDP-N-acetylglucosamine 2-epimerase (non-hydrolyzing) [Caballeronia novacaledonica]SPB15830.1 UDP-N-acetylglucosamine 2-epimerase [Caballeronia novacaledonica]